MTNFVAAFLNTQEELAVCQIVGHSYDLDAENLWDTMESILQKISSDPAIWSCTNLELVRYLKAMEQVRLGEGEITNLSDRPLWFRINGETVILPAQTTQFFDGKSLEK